MTETLRIHDQGGVNLPEDLRQKYGLQTGDVLHLVDLDGVFVLSPLMPIVPEIAREIERMRLDAGLSTDDLLQGLREQRERYYQEHYADEHPD